MARPWAWAMIAFTIALRNLSSGRPERVWRYGASGPISTRRHPDLLAKVAALVRMAEPKVFVIGTTMTLDNLLRIGKLKAHEATRIEVVRLLDAAE